VQPSAELYVALHLPAAGQARLQALQLRMIEHREQKGQRQLLANCMGAWRTHLCIGRSAQQLLQQVQRRQLQEFCGAWVLLTQQSRCVRGEV
jgi:hypothetical protein